MVAFERATQTARALKTVRVAMERPFGEGSEGFGGGFGEGFSGFEGGLSSSVDADDSSFRIEGLDVALESGASFRVDILFLILSWALTALSALSLMADVALGATFGGDEMEWEWALTLEQFARGLSIVSGTLSALVSLASLYRFYRWSTTHRALRHRFGDLLAVERDEDLHLLERLILLKRDGAKNAKSAATATKEAKERDAKERDATDATDATSAKGAEGAKDF